MKKTPLQPKSDIKIVLLMLCVALLGSLCIVGTYLPISHWFNDFDSGVSTPAEVAQMAEVPESGAQPTVDIIPSVAQQVPDTSIVVIDQTGSFAFEAPSSNQVEVMSEEQIRSLIKQNRMAVQKK